MANYYTLGASLPVLKQGEYRENELTSKEFMRLLSREITSRDKKLLELVLLRNDNQLLMQMLKGHELTQIDPELLVLGTDRLRYLIEATKAKVDYEPDPYAIEKPNLPEIDKKEFPKYMRDFVYDYLYDQKNDKISSYFYEDILFIKYINYVKKHGNEFLRRWFALEQDIASILAAITAEKYDLEKSKFLPGDNQLYKHLRVGDWREISFMNEAELVDKVREISNEEHLALREKKIDAMKWELLDKVTFADVFSINAMLVYLLKLQILERWERLDKLQGEKTFRRIVSGLNNEGSDELEKYRASVRIKRRSR